MDSFSSGAEFLNTILEAIVEWAQGIWANLLAYVSDFLSLFFPL